MSSTYIVTPTWTAQGNISPSTFVKQDTTNDFSILQAGANARTVGISQPGTHYPPGSPSDSGYAYISGESCTIFGLGAVCLLLLGSGGVTAGDLVESDASGAGVTSSTTGHNVGAIALETGAAGEYRKVQVVIYNHA